MQKILQILGNFTLCPIELDYSDTQVVGNGQKYFSGLSIKA